MKKLAALLPLLLLCFTTLAQGLNGVVIDKSTGLPIAGVTVYTRNQTTFTSFTGKFSLKHTPFGDTVKISYLGYKTNYFIASFSQSDTAKIILEQNTISLNMVTVNGKRDFKADSIKTRQDYARVFAYKAPTLKDIFITRSPYSTAYKPNNTSELFGFNLLTVISLLTKNSDPVSHLQKILLADEENSYIDQRFTKKQIISLTNLKTDSLQNFIYQYRPSIAAIKKMSDYDLIQYIKKSYQDFIRPGKAVTTSPFVR